MNDKVYAMKFHSTMTDNTFYVCSNDRELLLQHKPEVEKAFFDMVNADGGDDTKYNAYKNILQKYGFFEESDMYEPVNEDDFDIIYQHTSRF